MPAPACPQPPGGSPHWIPVAGSRVPCNRKFYWGRRWRKAGWALEFRCRRRSRQAPGSSLILGREVRRKHWPVPSGRIAAAGQIFLCRPQAGQWRYLADPGAALLLPAADQGRSTSHGRRHTTLQTGLPARVPGGMGFHPGSVERPRVGSFGTSSTCLAPRLLTCSRKPGEFTITRSAWR